MTAITITAHHFPHTSLPTVSTAIAETIAERAEHLFGLMGNGNAHVISHLTSAGFGFTSARHESAVVSMADAYFRATGKVGAATVTYGAGFTNTYTALAEARMARIPLVLVVGDGPTTGRRTFDIDQTSAADAVGVTTLNAGPDNAVAITHRAFDLAAQTFQPVVLAIPYDRATAPLTKQTGLKPLPIKPTWSATADELDRVAAILCAAERPLVLAGRGVVLSNTAAHLREVGDRLGALFMTSVMAANVIDSRWTLGIAGGFTRDHRLHLAQQADVVLVAGASLNPFQSRYGTLFAEGTQVIRLDNEAETDMAHPQVTHYLRADLGPALEGLIARIPAADPERSWRTAAPEVAGEAFRSADPVEDPDEFGSDGRLNPRAVVAALEEILPRERSVVMDGGHFIGWAPMYLSVPDPQAMVLVGTAFQSIGLGFGSAAGTSIARPERTTVFITGDGGGLMGLADLETFLRATRRGIVVVLNDSAYGAELHQYASKGLDPTGMLIDEVDFAAVGRTLGAEGIKVNTLADLTALEDWLKTHDEGVFIADVAISQKIIAEFMTASLAAGKKPATPGALFPALPGTKNHKRPGPHHSINATAEADLTQQAHQDSWRRSSFKSRILGGGTEPDPRFTLANERTFLAWIRTSLAMLAAGVAIEAFTTEIFATDIRKTLAVLLLFLALVIGGGSFSRWLNVERAMRRKAPLPFPAIAPVLAGGGAIVALVLIVFVLMRPT